MKPFTLSSMLLIALLALSGCGGQNSAEWDAYFNLFQSGQKFQGKVLHVTPSQMGDIILHVEYQDASGAPQAFIEMWPANKAMGFQPGMPVDVYVLPGGAISQGTAWMLKYKKIIQDAQV